MARPKSKGAYAPLAALYYLDDAILEAGPDAELLWLRILSFLASVPQANGFITDRQIRTVGINLRGVPKRVTSLTEVGLLTAEPGGFAARSWLKWNRSAEEIGKTLAKDRDRKASKHAENTPNSERNPTSFRTDSDPQYRTVQNSTEQTIKREPANRGSRLSPDWLPSTDSVAAVRIDAPDVNAKSEHPTFVDYWIAQPGQKGVKTNWDATWRNWMRRKQRDLDGARPTPEQRARKTLTLATDLIDQKAINE